jgi:hypothetical protein
LVEGDTTVSVFSFESKIFGMANLTCRVHLSTSLPIFWDYNGSWAHSSHLVSHRSLL